MIKFKSLNKEKFSDFLLYNSCVNLEVTFALMISHPSNFYFKFLENKNMIHIFTNQKTLDLYYYGLNVSRNYTGSNKYNYMMHYFASKK